MHLLNYFRTTSTEQSLALPISWWQTNILYTYICPHVYKFFSFRLWNSLTFFWLPLNFKNYFTSSREKKNLAMIDFDKNTTNITDFRARVENNELNAHFSISFLSARNPDIPPSAIRSSFIAFTSEFLFQFLNFFEFCPEKFQILNNLHSLVRQSLEVYVTGF